MKTNSITLLALDIDGVLTDGRVLYSSDGQEQKSVSFRDIDSVFEARRCGYQLALITGEDTPWSDMIGRRLQIEHVIRGAKDKLRAIRGLVQQLQIPLSAVCFLGDSDRDAPALAAVGLGLAPANATLQAKEAADVTLKSAGGNGAIREALEHIQRRSRATRPQGPLPSRPGKKGKGKRSSAKQQRESPR